MRITALENARNTLLAFGGSTFVGTVFAVFVGWLRRVRKADQLARQQVDRIVGASPGAVERLVQEHETEARVAVVSEDLELQGLLPKHGFRNLKSILPNAATTEALEPFAAVVLDLTAGLSPAAAGALIESCPRDVFLAYSTAPGRLDLPPGRAAFAKSPMTLYAQLMELLEFHQARNEGGSRRSRTAHDGCR